MDAFICYLFHSAFQGERWFVTKNRKNNRVYSGIATPVSISYIPPPPRPREIFLTAISTSGGVKGISRRLSPSVAAAVAAVAQQLRQTAATTLAAAVLIVASTSTEQDIMTAMMGLDPSLAPAKSGGTQTALTLPEDSGAPAAAAAVGPGEPPRLGSIDLTGQSSGAGEIPGGAGGGFRNGRLMVDESSDLAMTLGKKMKAPTVDPLTH